MEISVHINLFSLLLLLLLSRSFSSPASETCNPVDKEALLGFKRGITADPSRLLQSWTPSTDCCTSWKGVACDSRGRVVNVSRPGLFSHDDDYTYVLEWNSVLSLGNLSFLRVLDLGNLKNLNGPIPTEFGKLRRLTILVTSLQGRYRRHSNAYLAWKSFISTTTIHRRTFSISGVVSESKPYDRQHPFIDFEANPSEQQANRETTGHNRPACHSYSNMVIQQQFNRRDSLELRQLRNLQFLYLSRNNLCGRVPIQVVKLQNLQRLDVSFNPLMESNPIENSKKSVDKTLHD
ncbi:polygalacturonase inhibitor 3-like [Hibiscus syriacus]|uniref:polygalacturonase inhibitor 3-like n=1 Tax=Hibiscus syriacus TaxID=106335 RepID=UPI001923D852|nr:polygalacturonase inhibitor 3-like [Hibiscus syriacus]